MAITLIINHLLLLLAFPHCVFSLDQWQIRHCSHHDDLVSDRAGLLAIKASIFSETNILSNWTFTDGEDDGAICNWIGVLCQDSKLGKRVVNLTLQRKGLQGTVSPFISNLSALVTLDLSENRLHGVIPYSISDLTNLMYLSFDNNQLQGHVPDLSRLSGLAYISLATNHFSGEIPRFLFRNCTRLRYLDLSSNKFAGTIPTDIGNSLSTLETLNLYDNLLYGKLPASFRNCSALRGLDVENNGFYGELPADMFCQTKSLEYLHLSDNNFISSNNNTNLVPFFSGLGKCVNLSELELSGIRLSGELPANIGVLLPISLSELLLDRNTLTGEMPPSISKLTNLRLLNLSSNQLHGTIPTEIGLMENLERLCLSDNYFTGTIPVTIGTLKHIGLLDLSGNRLLGEIPDALSNLTQLRKLFLHGNQLSGSIPASLGKCVTLETLDLSRNRLTGRIPLEIGGLKELKIYLNLSGNLLTGPMPVEIGKMDMVQEIDLSFNNLSGSIIPQLADCVAAQLINLSRNSLDGLIPTSIGTMQNLLSLDLSFNFLSGEIPVSLETCTSLVLLNLSYNSLTGMVPAGGVFTSLDVTSFLHNPLLCGFISGLSSCTKSKTQRLAFRNTRILALVLASIVSVTFFVLTICCFIYCTTLKKAFFVARDNIDVRFIQPPLRTKYLRISYAELLEATNSFDPRSLIGTGSYGEVYRGELKDRREVAIKVLKMQGKNSSKSFDRECQVLRSIRHRNLMRIITACSRPDFKALVLPFMAKGSLESHLYPISDLSLTQRVNICSDIAEGIAYLHHHSPVKVIHCDLKPSNILLNDDMTALVSDFGIARLIMSAEEGAASAPDTLPNSTANLVIGSVGYIPPEYGMGRGASTKGDVFSFGMLVLEMVTRRKPTDDMFCSGLSLQEWVKRHHYHGLVEDVLDTALLSTAGIDSHHHGDPHHQDAQYCRKMWECVVVELVELGLLCTQHSPSARPTMMDAAEDLERLKRYLAGDTSVTFASSIDAISSTSTMG